MNTRVFMLTGRIDAVAEMLASKQWRITGNWLRVAELRRGFCLERRDDPCAHCVANLQEKPQ